MPSSSGIDAMRQRMARASRTPPPPRKTRETEVERTPAEPVAPEEEESRPSPAETPATRRGAGAARRLRVAADAPAANLAIRVRRPLDDRLAELVHGLWQSGIRTSKVELVEMLLWELPATPTRELRQRIAAFRAAAPRGPAPPLD